MKSNTITNKCKGFTLIVNTTYMLYLELKDPREISNNYKYAFTAKNDNMKRKTEFKTPFL